ncbi:unnamed protein product, partial [Prorocentrum cordatum]
MSLAKRRAEQEARFGALEERQDYLERVVRGLKRKVNEVTKSCHLVCEGCHGLQALYEQHVPANKFRELREAAPETLVRDLAAKLEEGWPLQGDTANVSSLRKLLEGLSEPGTLRGVYQQVRTEQGSKVPVPGTFYLVLRFSIDSLAVERSVQRFDAPLRRASGLAVRGAQPPPLPAGQDPPAKVLLWVEKTPEEKEAAEARRQAKGRGKGNKGRVKGGKGGGKSSGSKGDKSGGKGGGKGGRKGGKGGRKGGRDGGADGNGAPPAPPPAPQAKAEPPAPAPQAKAGPAAQGAAALSGAAASAGPSRPPPAVPAPYVAE